MDEIKFGEFLLFLKKFEITQEWGAKRFVPLDASQNVFRHLGIKIGKKLILNIEEVLYVFDPSLEVGYPFRMYFALKNLDYNLFRFNDMATKYFIYKKTSKFNRNKDTPLALCILVHKYDHFRDELEFFFGKPTIYCVFDGEMECFICVKRMPLSDIIRGFSSTGRQKRPECLQSQQSSGRLRY